MTPEQPNDDVFQNLREGFSDFGRKVGSFMDDMFSSEGEGGQLKVRTDIYYTDSHYVIELELPGTKKEEVSIQIHEGELIVKGQKLAPAEAATYRYERKDRRFGPFLMRFPLPLNVEMENIKAKYEGGLLRIYFPYEGRKPAGDEAKIDIE
jgi:HSP20 family protein